MCVLIYIKNFITESHAMKYLDLLILCYHNQLLTHIIMASGNGLAQNSNKPMTITAWCGFSKYGIIMMKLKIQSQPNIQLVFQ